MAKKLDGSRPDSEKVVPALKPSVVDMKDSRGKGNRGAKQSTAVRPKPGRQKKNRRDSPSTVSGSPQPETRAVSPAEKQALDEGRARQFRAQSLSILERAPYRIPHAVAVTRVDSGDDPTAVVDFVARHAAHIAKTHPSAPMDHPWTAEVTAEELSSSRNNRRR